MCGDVHARWSEQAPKLVVRLLLLLLSSQPSLRDEMGCSRYLIALSILLCGMYGQLKTEQVPHTRRRSKRLELDDGYSSTAMMTRIGVSVSARQCRLQ